MRKHAVRKSIVAAVIVAIIAIVGVISRSSVQAQGRSSQAPGRPDLEALHQRLLPLFELAGVVFTDADERTGRLVVGVMDRDIEPTVRAWARAQGVPFQSVDVVETAPIVQVSTLRDRIPKVQGGLQIRFSQFLCSLSFIAWRGTVLGYVTASHCSNTQGAIDGTLYYQPVNQVTDEFIGTEKADPAFFRNANGCPRGKKCRWSDANFSEGANLPADRSFGLGVIAKTSAPNIGSLDITGTFSITGEGTAGSGTANKVGRTTGWTSGPVTRTCVNTGVSGSNIVLLCQNFVENPSAVIVDAGDSGSPVFMIDPVNTNSVTLLGTLWGGDTSGHLFVYSPIANIEQELGSLTTH